jgi:hypothetical protein
VGVLAGLTLGLGGLMGWHVTHRPDMGYARALGALDATLAQTWTTLPKGAQERLADAYRQLGMLSPGLRK